MVKLWVPEQSYIQEYGMADKLAKQRASSHFYELALTFSVSKAQIYEELYQCERRQSLSLWKEIFE